MPYFYNTFTTLCNIQSGFFYLRAFPALQSCARILLSTRNSQTQLSLSICYFSTSAREVSPSQTKSIMQGTTLQTWIFLSAVHMRSDYPQHQPPCGIVGRSFFSPGVFSTRWQDMEGFLIWYSKCCIAKANKCWTVCTVSIFFLPANRRRGVTMFSQYYYNISKYFDNIWNLALHSLTMCKASIFFLLANRRRGRRDREPSSLIGSKSPWLPQVLHNRWFFFFTQHFGSWILSTASPILKKKVWFTCFGFLYPKIFNVCI